MDAMVDAIRIGCTQSIIAEIGKMPQQAAPHFEQAIFKWLSAYEELPLMTFEIGGSHSRVFCQAFTTKFASELGCETTWVVPEVPTHILHLVYLSMYLFIYLLLLFIYIHTYTYTHRMIDLCSKASHAGSCTTTKG